jgi:hypothetical protein
MIRVVDIVTHEIRYIRPGTAPFWSPDGRLLGSITPAHRVEIGPPVRGNSKLLGPRGVVMADWQARSNNRDS